MVTIQTLRYHHRIRQSWTRVARYTLNPAYSGIASESQDRSTFRLRIRHTQRRIPIYVRGENLLHSCTSVCVDNLTVSRHIDRCPSPNRIFAFPQAGCSLEKMDQRHALKTRAPRQNALYSGCRSRYPY